MPMLEKLITDISAFQKERGQNSQVIERHRFPVRKKLEKQTEHLSPPVRDDSAILIIIEWRIFIEFSYVKKKIKMHVFPTSQTFSVVET